jgi:hypothetical protein
MKKEDFKNFIDRAQSLGLSEHEKEILRSKIMEFISFNPIRGKAPLVRERSYVSIFEVRHFMKAASLVLIIAVVVGGSGVSYAASNALPGEALYAVKVNINEHIESAVATTPKAKLAVQSEHIQRRLDEVQTLRKENKLSPVTQKIVIAKLDEHTHDASVSIDQLREQGDVSSVLEATSNLTPIFEANKDILEKENNKADPENAVEDTDTLIAKIDDSTKVFQDKEDSVIASVEDDSSQPAIMAMTMTEVTEPDPAVVAADKAAKKATDKAASDVKAISKQISNIVEDRIDSAKEKIAVIKAEIAAEETLELEIETVKPVEETPVTKTEVIPESTPTVETVSKESISLRTATSSIKIENPNVSSSLPTTVSEVPTAEVTTTVAATGAPIDADMFDTSTKIKDAENLIRKAEKLLDEKRFKEALMIAQDVNRIASEIETHRRLKALDLAKQDAVSETELKASVSESVKN